MILRRVLDSRIGSSVLLCVLPCLRLLLSGLGMKSAYMSVEIALTRRTRLFDREHYLRQFAGTVASLPLRHYVTEGDRAGLSPNPLFDQGHYLAALGRSALPVNALLHYALLGRFRRVSPSPVFDIGYYLATNPDVAASGRDPLYHFSRWGWREGRNPLPGSPLNLGLSRTALKVAKTNPLAHCLSQGLPLESLFAAPLASSKRDYTDPSAWEGLAPRTQAPGDAVDVLIPVYRGLQETLRCIHSVLVAPVCTPYVLVVIDDAGPDGELRRMLDTLAERGLFVLERNPRNLGFVKTVNRGLRLYPTRDVVILNSDTQVFNDWLDRLLAHAARVPSLGTITPLSNNATICSYPQTLQQNLVPPDIDASSLDRLAAEVNAGVLVSAPTGVGFCMYMRRACIEQAGLLDEANFGRGYGEENDFCMRALRQGWDNAIAADVFVFHEGSTSFGTAEAARRSEKALQVLKRLHPDYPKRVQAFIEADPLHPHRARLDLARLKRRAGSGGNILLVTHDRGGGTERHVGEETATLEAGGAKVFELRPSKWSGHVALGAWDIGELPNLARWSGPQALVDALRDLGLAELHIHHLIDFPPGVHELLASLRDGLGLRLVATLHDYYSVCPRINLVGPQQRYCGEPDEAGCNACLAQDSLIRSSGRIQDWREQHSALLAMAHEVKVPDEDVARRVSRYYPGLRLKVVPHEEEAVLRPSAAAAARTPGPLRVLVLGAISKIKGYDIVLGMAQAARQHGLPLKVELLGYSMNDGPLASAGVEMLGRYVDGELVHRIQERHPDFVFIPSIWPETYCYTLSAAFKSGCRVAVFDIGAQARRVRNGYPNHLILPLAYVDQPEAVCEAILRETKNTLPPSMFSSTESCPSSVFNCQQSGSLAFSESTDPTKQL
ncbi:glycosyltransferase [Caldimonas tepidiphila]|uniref:glycosyltransferase n=1 Tax=Caldimonas tepidiphila TaxID=2315841 RepID=UPI000E5B7B6B|nr:glycosyltransferase [Caldimonas tepidiphila]